MFSIPSHCIEWLSLHARRVALTGKFTQMCLWNMNSERSPGVTGVDNLILCLQTQATSPRKRWGPDSSVSCSDVLVSVSSQPGHQGSAGRGVTAPPTTGGQPAPATPRQPSLCGSCFQPLHPDPEKAGGFLTLLGLPLWQVEAPPPAPTSVPYGVSSLWLSGHTDSDTTHTASLQPSGHWSVLMLFFTCI